MDDNGALIAFLNARLDEDAEIARRAGDSFRQIGETGVIVATDRDRAEECASANWAGVAEHIVRHDPARALREVAAKRSAIEEYEAVIESLKDYDPDDGSGRATVSSLRGVLTAMAAVYVDHPDYRQEWTA